MEHQWKRPTATEFPKIWSKFTSKSKNNVTNNIRIEDITPKDHNEVLSFMKTHYLSNEPVFKSVEILLDEQSVKEYEFLIECFLKKNISVKAVLDNDSKPEIVGVHVRYIESRHETKNLQIGKSLLKVKKLLNDVEEKFNPFEGFECDTILHGFGLSVHTGYQGLGIRYHLLSSLENMATEFNIGGCATSFSSTGAQIAATKAGFKCFSEIFYKEYKDNGEVVFSIEDTSSIKFMGKKYSKEHR